MSVLTAGTPSQLGWYYALEALAMAGGLTAPQLAVRSGMDYRTVKHLLVGSLAPFIDRTGDSKNRICTINTDGEDALQELQLAIAGNAVDLSNLHISEQFALTPGVAQQLHKGSLNHIAAFVHLLETRGDTSVMRINDSPVPMSKSAAALFLADLRNLKWLKPDKYRTGVKPLEILDAGWSAGRGLEVQLRATANGQIGRMRQVFAEGQDSLTPLDDLAEALNDIASLSEEEFAALLISESANSVVLEKAVAHTQVVYPNGARTAILRDFRRGPVHGNPVARTILYEGRETSGLTIPEYLLATRWLTAGVKTNSESMDLFGLEGADAAVRAITEAVDTELAEIGLSYDVIVNLKKAPTAAIRRRAEPLTSVRGIDVALAEPVAEIDVVSREPFLLS